MRKLRAPARQAMGTERLAVVSFNRVPRHNPSFKYQRLGAMALVNQAQYCRRHGYSYFCATPAVEHASQACWAKIPALLQALQTHRWVLWADSDALVFNPERRLEGFCDPQFDIVTQCPRSYFKRIGMDEARGLRLQPLNTGVLLLQATDWTRRWLQQAYQLRPASPIGDDWNGLGDQEALIEVLQRIPGDLQHPANVERIAYAQGLQAHPSLHEPGDLFVHFYGNQADHRISPDQVQEVLQRWEQAIENGGALPNDLARFHWCCIQNKSATEAVNRGGPERFLYQASDLEVPCEALD